MYEDNQSGWNGTDSSGNGYSASPDGSIYTGTAQNGSTSGSGIQNSSSANGDRNGDQSGIQSSAVQNDTVQSSAIQNDSVQSGAIQNDSVQSGAVQNDSVQNASAQNGSLLNGTSLSSSSQGSTYQGSAYQGNAYQGSAYQGNTYQDSTSRSTGRNFDPQTGEPLHGSRNAYGSYQQPNQTRNAWQTGTVKPALQSSGGNKPPKKGGILKKLALVVASALVFGCVAGATMVGINHFAGKKLSSSAKQETQIQANNGNENSDKSKADDSGSKARIGSGSGSTSSGSSTGSGTALDVSGIVEKAMPSVVAINGKSQVTQSDFFGQQQTYEAKSAGSGIIIGENDSELLVVTNNHVVEGTNAMTVTFIDNTTASAVAKGTDSESDVAVLAIKKSDISSDTMNKISIASIGDSDSLKVGQGVIAIGNAMGYGQSVTVGYVSALNRTIEASDSTTGETVKTQNLVQTDAAINPGNSGGALLDMNGNVIGINESKAVSTSVEGMGYAIPISRVTSIINTLSNQKTRNVVSEDQQGYLGIQGQNIDAQMGQAYDMPKGVYIYKILDGGAASKSDLHEKDIITKIDGQSISTMAELKEKLTYYSQGENVPITVKRLNGSQYEEKEIQVTLENKSTLESQSSSLQNGNKQNSDQQNSDQQNNGKAGNGKANGGNNSDNSGNSSDSSGSQNGGSSQSNGNGFDWFGQWPFSR